MSDELGQKLHDEVVRLQERVKYNRALALEYLNNPKLSETQHECAVIAHVQETIVVRLQSLLDLYWPGEYHTFVQEDNMNTTQSLAGTGKSYCQFVVEVSGGEWGQPKKIELIEKVGGGCGGYTKEQRTELKNFNLPVALPAGRYTMQAKVVEAPKSGGCGGYGTKPGSAHIQFKRPANTPAFVQGNRDYGWAWESSSAELLAALLK